MPRSYSTIGISALYWWESTHNGYFITIYGPGNRTAFLQGDDAATFLDRIAGANEIVSEADVCCDYIDAIGDPLSAYTEAEHDRALSRINADVVGLGGEA
jgi:hypothetical protein